MPATTRIREWAGRLGLVVGSLLGCVVLLELALQAGSLVLRATGREIPAGWLTGDRRILCLGDSNTYGLYLEPGEAYPKQLEALWIGSGTERVEVLNFGFPGTNSSKLVSDLPRLIDTLEPELVTILVGANDFWTQPLAAPQASKERRPAWGIVRKHSRVHRLFRLLRRRLEPVELETSLDATNTFERGTGRARYGDMEIELGWRSKTGPSGKREMNRLHANLRELVDQGREQGVGLVLLTYPSRFGLYTLPNFVIREFARSTGTPLVDLAEVFEPACPAEACPDLLFPDHHPTARGHRLIAETLLQRLRADEGRGPVR